MVEVKGGLAEEAFRPFVFEQEQAALDGTNGDGTDVTVDALVKVGIIHNVGNHRAQVTQADHFPAIVLGDAVNDGECAFLRFAEIHDARQQHRPDFVNGQAQRDAAFAIGVPEAHRAAAQVIRTEAELRHALANEAAAVACAGHAGKVAFGINKENRDARVAEGFGHFAQGNGFTGAGRAGNQSVAVCHAAKNGKRVLFFDGVGDGERGHERS